MSTNDGGPAFPYSFGDDTCFLKSGMSLRDYFAGQVITSLSQKLEIGKVTWERWAEEAYEIADAMLAARNKENSE